MKKNRILFLLVLVSSLTFSLSINALHITNLKSGSLCKSTQNSRFQVCEEKQVIEIAGESTCVAANEREPCTWYGYSFDYTADSGDSELSCQYQYSRPIAGVNTRRFLPVSIDKKISYQLSGTSGHYVFPQYRLFQAVQGAVDNSLVENISCFHEGNLVFKVRFKTVEPVALIKFVNHY